MSVMENDATEMDRLLRDLARSPVVWAFSEKVRTRMGYVMGASLDAIVRQQYPLEVLRRLLPLLHKIVRRTNYLALLHEYPYTLQRMVDVLARSAFLGERLATSPLLLDELLDTRISGALPSIEEMHQSCAAVLDETNGDIDIEGALNALNELRHALSFRVALATLDGRELAENSVRFLAHLADAVISVVLRLAWQEMENTHGVIEGMQIAIIGYGGLGAYELRFGSDLDLVLLYEADEHKCSNGLVSLSAGNWASKLTQKLIRLLGVEMVAGKLFQVDVRLRPDGGQAH